MSINKTFAMTEELRMIKLILLSSQYECVSTVASHNWRLRFSASLNDIEITQYIFIQNNSEYLEYNQSIKFD
jgi:hypothetical protein